MKLERQTILPFNSIFFYNNINWLSVLFLVLLAFSSEAETIGAWKNMPSDIQICENLNDKGQTTWTSPSILGTCGAVKLMSTHQPGETFPVGNTKVIYYAFDDCGFVDMMSFTVRVLPSPEVTILENVEKDGIKLTAKTTNAATYQWSSGATSESIKAYETDAFQVTASTEEGCQSIATIFVNHKKPLLTSLEGANFQASKDFR